MKKGGLKFCCLVLFFIFIFTSPMMAENTTVNLVSRVIESFDNPEESIWIVRGSKFITEGFPKSSFVDAWPEALFGANKEGLDLKVLGVAAKWDRQGYNFLEFIPADQEGNLKPITIPGKVKSIDMWVWGSNYNYYLEVHLLDYKGIVHTLKLGDLNFTGWKNLKVDVPGTIPQTGGYLTSQGFSRELKLVKLVLWTTPRERVDDYVIFLDHIKVLTDVFIPRFDGDDLVTRLSEIWGGNNK